jgi:hypothetical protein
MIKEYSVKLTTTRAAFMMAACATLAWSTACQTKTEVTAGNSNAAVGNASPQATASQTEVAKTAPSAPASPGSLATPTDAYKFGFEARQRKDIVALKRVMAKNAIEFLTMIGQEEKKTLDDQLKELAERPQGPTSETRNEKISGDRATLEYLDVNGKWVTMDLAKEDGDWKIDLPKGP